MSPNVGHINVDGAQLKEGDALLEENSDVRILSVEDLDSDELKLGNDEADGKLVADGKDEEEGRVDSEVAVLFVGCVDLLGKVLKEGVLLLKGIPLSFFDGLALKDGFNNSDSQIDLVGWDDFLGLELNEGMLLMDGIPLNEN